jgi:spermidine synthase
MRKHRRKRAVPREIGRIKGQSSTVIVTELGSRLSFRFAENDTLIQGSMYRDHPLDFRSEYLGGHLAASLCHAAPRRALCLGLGIGALPRLLLSTHPSIHIDCVESNDAVIKAAYTYFKLMRHPNLRVIHDHAERFIESALTPESYDLIFLDCYDANGVAPACTTTHFFMGLLRGLTSTGLLVMNLIPDRHGVDLLRRQAVQALQEPWRVACPSKSNQTVFGSPSATIDLGGIVDRARAIDQGATTGFYLINELRRTHPLTLDESPQISD